MLLQSMRPKLKSPKVRDELDQLVESISESGDISISFNKNLRKRFMKQALKEQSFLASIIRPLKLRMLSALVVALLLVSTVGVGLYQLNQPKDGGLIAKIYAANADIYQALLGSFEEVKPGTFIKMQIDTKVGPAYNQCIHYLNLNKLTPAYADSFESYEYLIQKSDRQFMLNKSIAKRDGKIMQFNVDDGFEMTTYLGGKYAITSASIANAEVKIWNEDGTENTEVIQSFGSIADQASPDFIPRDYKLKEVGDILEVSWDQETFCANKVERKAFSIKTVVKVNALTNKILSIATYNSSSELMSESVLKVERQTDVAYENVKDLFKFDLKVETRKDNEQAPIHVPDTSERIKNGMVASARRAIAFLEDNKGALIAPDTQTYRFGSINTPVVSLPEEDALTHYVDPNFYPQGELGAQMLNLATIFRTTSTQLTLEHITLFYRANVKVGEMASNDIGQGVEVYVYAGDRSVSELMGSGAASFYPLRDLPDRIVKLDGKEIKAKVYVDSQTQSPDYPALYTLGFSTNGFTFLVKVSGEKNLDLNYKTIQFNDREDLIRLITSNEDTSFGMKPSDLR
jgi:hypothetical protein